MTVSREMPNHHMVRKFGDRFDESGAARFESVSSIERQRSIAGVRPDEFDVVHPMSETRLQEGRADTTTLQVSACRHPAQLHGAVRRLHEAGSSEPGAGTDHLIIGVEGSQMNRLGIVIAIEDDRPIGHSGPQHLQAQRAHIGGGDPADDHDVPVMTRWAGADR